METALSECNDSMTNKNFQFSTQNMNSFSKDVMPKGEVKESDVEKVNVELD